MPLATDCFRCPGSRCPDFIRETCRRFVDLRAGVGPGTPYADASVGRHAVQCLDGTFRTCDFAGEYAACPHKWPLTT